MVGCGNATDRIQENQNVTVSCAEGDTGYVYAEILDFSVKSSSVGTMPDLPLKIMMNVGNPDRAFDFACLPNEGVGLARLEFIINRMIGVHLAERVLRRSPDGRDLDAGRGILPETSDCASFRL